MPNTGPEIMLFCTTDVPGPVLDELFRFPHSQDAINKHINERGPCYYLVRGPADPPMDGASLKTSPPTSDVTTGFRGMSMEALGNVHRDRYAQEIGEPDGLGLSYNAFMVIDERGVKDKTILMVRYFADDVDDDNADEWCDSLPTGWAVLRVPFVAAKEVSFGIAESDFELYFDCGDEAITDEGVFVVNGLEEAYREHGWKVEKDFLKHREPGYAAGEEHSVARL